MKRRQLRFGKGFRVVLGNRKAQAAGMVLQAGESEGGPTNCHQGCDQWLYVVSGVGTAIVNGKSLPLREGTLIVIERGDRHEIRNSSRRPLRTVNIYVPPAYRANGDELHRARCR